MVEPPTSGGPAGGATGAEASGTGRHREPHHFRRMIAAWVVLCAVGDLVWWFVAGPHVPPGDMTSSASGDQFDFNVLMLAAIPVVLAVWTYGAYALVSWRASRPESPEPASGPDARARLRIQVAWIVTTTVIVLAAFVFGTVELMVSAGAGGGEGPNPIWTPASKSVLPIQVIAQEWKFTYRYPTFGGMETQNLVIPDDTTIAFHVTSIDVIHSFWAYQLGVKADANPQIDNIAYTTTKQLGTFTVRCSELCGIWHGAMYNYGRVVSKSQFEHWGTTTEHALADNTKNLPAFAWTYSPTANTATGGTGIDTNGQGPYSKVEHYGATPAKKSVTSPSTSTTAGTS